MAGSPTGTVTFLFTDIQGSTSMWERDARRMQSALARHDEIMKATFTAHGGHVFKTVGDACYAAFASAPAALRAALAAQRAIFAEPWDERSRVRVRMALHSGEAEERDGDYFGPPLNRVARLLSAGHGGQTLLSRAARQRIGEELPEGVSLRDMGGHRLKDLREPERIFQLLAPDLPSEFPPLKTLETSSNEDRYRLIKKIGSGGMAEVYLAYDEFLEREVAFKVLDRKYAENRDAIERFRREARNAASLRHPTITAPADNSYDTDGAIAFSGAAEANTTVKLYEGTLLKGTVAASSTGAWSISLTGVADGKHSYTVTATDQAGNASAPSAARTVTVDRTKPQVNIVTPPNGAIGRARNTNLTATFLEKMNPATINKATFALYKVTSSGTTQVTGVTVTMSADGLTATLNPYGTTTTKLAASTRYKAIVTTGAKDVAGNALDQTPTAAGNQPKVWYFTTGATY